MLRRCRAVLALIPSFVLVSCLADIPELSSGSSGTSLSSSTGGPITSGSSSTGSSSTGVGGGVVCDGRPNVEICATFDDVAAVDEGWDETQIGSMGMIELSTNHDSPPYSFHASIGSGTSCSNVLLTKSFADDPSLRIRLEFDMNAGASTPAAALYWERPGGAECIMYVRHQGNHIAVSLQANPEALEPYYVYAQGAATLATWGRVELELDRAAQTISDFRWNETPDAGEMGDGITQDIFDGWWDLCGGASSTGQLRFELGPHCAADIDVYYDDVMLDLFE